MKKIDPVVRRETAYIAVSVLVLSAVMELVFLFLGYFDYTVPLGNLLGGGIGVLNFFLMGLGVQSAVGLDEKAAREKVKFSMTMRYLMIVAAAAIGIIAPCFNTAAALIPLFFNRIAVALRPLFSKYLGDADGTDPAVVTPAEHADETPADTTAETSDETSEDAENTVSDPSSVSVKNPDTEGGEK